MTWRALSASLLIASLFLVSSCGDDQSTTTRLDREVAASYLINRGDFSKGAVRVRGLPAEPCGPVALVESVGGQAAESQMFAFAHARVQEAVGVFDTAQIAKEAFEVLGGESHLECIRSAIETFNASRGDRVATVPSRELGVADEDALARYLIIRPGVGMVRYVDLVTVRSGPRVASVVVIVSRGKPSDDLVRGVSETAVGELAKEKG